jgi:hypothetical protein
MKVFTTAAVVILLVLGLSARPARALITYDLISYPDYQCNQVAGGSGPVWSLTGHIITDGALGYLSASDVLAWDWESSLVDSAGSIRTFGGSSASSGASIDLFGLNATATTLTLDLARVGTSRSYQGTLSLTNADSEIHWFWFLESGDGGSRYRAHGTVMPDQIPRLSGEWNTTAFVGSLFATNVPSPPAELPPTYGAWLIGSAEVPEPATATLLIWLLLGRLGIAFALWWRRRKAV